MVEQVVVKPDETSPNLEAEAAAQEANAKQTQEPKLAGEEDTPERPSWLPEKFKSPEDLAKAYSELEKARGKGEKVDPQTEEAQDAANEAVQSAGLDMEALSNEYAENGELSEDSLKSLEAQGITKDMVDAYIAGQEAQAQELRSELLEPVGGDQEQYDEMVSWAADNLDDQQINDFNEAIESGSKAAIKLAIADLAKQYGEANGVEPSRTVSGKTTSTGTGVYESTADLMKDMQNPEYHTNEAFRAKVAAKLDRSNIL